MLNMLYVVCGNCGREFGKYGIRSVHEAPCPKCGAILRIETHDRDVIVTVVETRQERKQA